jgi:hypothetical protein
MTPRAPLTFTLTARGHENIRASHRSTFEITTDSELTLQGDCIIGVKASHSALDLKPFLEKLLNAPRCQIRTTLTVGPFSDTILGWISPPLLFTASSSLVWRTSSYIDDRTIAIQCDKAAKDIDRRLITALQNPQSVLEVQLIVDYDTRRSRTT